MEAYTDAGDIVFEPFGGIGHHASWPPSAPAAWCRAVEIAPEYVDVAIKRFQQNFPDVPVTLVATGQTFDAVAAERLAEHRHERSPGWPTRSSSGRPTSCVPYARNARTHSDAQVAQIAASIAEFGFTNPILAGSDGVIVAGHGRLAAAQKLGLDIGAGGGARPPDADPAPRAGDRRQPHRRERRLGRGDAAASNWPLCRTTTSI